MRTSRINSTIVGVSKPDRIAQTLAWASHPINEQAWEELLALPKGQVVQDRRHEAMRNIKAGEAIFARPASHILRREIVRHAPDGASVIQRFGPGVAEQRGQIR